MTTPSEPDIMILTGLVINPGDTLVVSSFDSSASPEHLTQIRDRLLRELPGINVLIISGADVSKITPSTSGGN